MDNLRCVEVSSETLLAMRNILKVFLSRDVYINVSRASSQQSNASEATLQLMHVYGFYDALTKPLEELLTQAANASVEKGVFLLGQQIFDEYTSVFSKSPTREEFGFMDQNTFDTHIQPLLVKLPEIRTALSVAPEMNRDELLTRMGIESNEPGPESMVARANPPKKSFMN